MELLLEFESMLESVSRVIKGIEESKLVAWSKVLSGEMWSISISSTLGEVEFEEVEAVGDVAAEAAKEEGWELVHYCTLSLFDIWVTRQSAEWEPPISTGTL